MQQHGSELCRKREHYYGPRRHTSRCRLRYWERLMLRGPNAT